MFLGVIDQDCGRLAELLLALMLQARADMLVDQRPVPRLQLLLHSKTP